MFLAKKQFGQNFLKDENILQKIVEIGDISLTDTVLEIGPGLGNLTKKILEKSGKVITIEKDRDLIPKLQTKFQTEIKTNKLILIEGDILKINPKQLGLKKYKVIANIPYYLTGEIFKLIFEKWPIPEKLVFLVQKEVAERIVAKDGKESILSISIKKFGKPRQEFIVKAGSFSPAPKVNSAVISVSNIKKCENIKTFFEILKLGFSHKRKTLFKNLKEKFNSSNLEIAFKSCDLDLKTRPENLSVKNWDCLNSKILKIEN